MKDRAITRVRVALRVALVGLTMTALAACSVAKPQEPLGSLTMGEAKQATLSTENEIAGYVPSENVGKTRQLAESSTLFNCGDGFTWPGQTVVNLSGSPDIPAILNAVEKHWAALDGWKVLRYKDSAGEETLDMRGPGKTQFLVGPENRHTVLQIDSRSACFALPGGMQPGEKY